MHTPVLLSSFLAIARPKSGEIWVDCTLGGGSYTKAIAKEVGEKGRVIALDWDQANLDAFAPVKPSNVVTVLANFKDITAVLQKLNIEKVAGLVADLGFSSDQLTGKGFSFQNDEPLDMRLFSPATNLANQEELTAQTIVNKFSLPELIKILKDFGEEKKAVAIANLIVKKRCQKPITTTKELKTIVEEVYGTLKTKNHKAPATKTFMALRIVVNQELDNLATLLKASPELLEKSGRLSLVTFHSLEDRLVKKFMKQLAANCHCPEDATVCTCNQQPIFKLLTKKPCLPTPEEVAQNPRSRSARLRIAQKI